jgi:S-DNA-T family DNA segregation ATPase FtsK/SpoIIIE
MLVMLASCGNMKIIDTTYTFDRAIIRLPNGEVIEGKVESWSDFDDGDVDEVYIMALKIVISLGSASIAMIQRKCSVGYSRAGKIIEWMEKQGFISEFEGAKSRRVLITMEEFEKRFGKR